MNETKTKQSVTQQKSNWKPWQIVLVILLGLCALPVVVPVGLGLLAAAGQQTEHWVPACSVCWPAAQPAASE